MTTNIDTDYTRDPIAALKRREHQRPATLVYFEDKAGKYRWRIKSSNGRVICASSQGYATLVDAQKNVMLLGALLGGYNGGYGDRLFVGHATGEVQLWK